MIFSIILGLALFAITCYLVLLFFQVHRIERQVTDLIQTVEVHIINRYGHNPNKQVQLMDAKKAMEEEDVS